MHGPGSSKKNGVGGLNRKLPFPKRTQLAKKKKWGGVVHSPISLKYHCLPMVHSNTVAPRFVVVAFF